MKDEELAARIYDSDEPILKFIIESAGCGGDLPKTRKLVRESIFADINWRFWKKK